MDNNENFVQAEKPKKKKKKWWIILVVVAILLIAIFSGSSDDSKPKVDTPDSSNSSSQTDETTKDATKEIKVGSSVTDDDLKITFKSCDTNYTKYNKYATVTKGCKVVRAQFTFENISDTDKILDGFECYADGEKCEYFYFGGDDSNSPTLESVSPGRKFSAVIYYEVPKDTKKIEFEYESDFWSSDKYIFVVE